MFLHRVSINSSEASSENNLRDAGRFTIQFAWKDKTVAAFLSRVFGVTSSRLMVYLHISDPLWSISHRLNGFTDRGSSSLLNPFHHSLLLGGRNACYDNKTKARLLKRTMINLRSDGWQRTVTRARTMALLLIESDGRLPLTECHP